MTDVVVTGYGASTPIGGDAASTWDALLAGKSGVRPTTGAWVERHDLPVKISAQLAVEPTDVLPRVQARRMDRAEQVAVIVAREAWAHAGLAVEKGEDPKVDPTRLAVVVGTGIGGVTTLLDQDDLLETEGLRKVSPLVVPMLMPNGPAALISLEIGAQGGVHSPASACATGAEAMAWAWRLLKSGEVDVVLAGGAEACIAPITVAGFVQARTLSQRNDAPSEASRPFDTGRDGFVLGEGAGVMVLERREFAEARGATIHGTLAGIGLTSDAYHITGPDPEGGGQGRAMLNALRTAGLEPADVGHVNCHATSTVVGDVGEANAIRKALGDHPVLTAPKGAMGHLVGGAGAVEGIVALLSVRDGIIPPTLNLQDKDPKVELDVVAGEPLKMELTAAINNSFGFGGHNASLLFTK